ncbi:mannose-1-phosphate guanylyltransferase/mannose-6-phosphate isomerase [Luteibacter aegosomaticola]|uniref:mannose-1-phosphate guanylyltransferase/mannose-6-phosphate isomerase n=1 Tax=Luteibacter aegosomaticola TaxID=2911538 RepID=UPI001FF8BE6F|nr:mannose-1-phosphate guanylyltransferase/mannose-6-phosphate isomerase [Luteibacter aegosomaticola]UPG92297.1 mannose-1-phosphate guanylyltransferase/mannose-6-phosphate isomerase [Luteibacter aegosomaticola]
MDMLIPVILSGGSGTRLWPLSRKNRPKQFLALMGENTLFQQTVLRTTKLDQAQAPIIVCSEDHRFTVAEQLQELRVGGASILLEPAARNTAPAIALAAMQAASSDPEALLLVLPADHLIGDEASFTDAVRRAAPLAADGWLVTFGIRPEAPETGFGYIKRAESVSPDGFKVAQFVEKPDSATAERYVASGEFDWNSGMFLFKAGRFLDELKACSPAIHDAVASVYATAKPDLDFVRFDKTAMAAVPEDSIDYAVMEKTKHAAVVPVSCRWSDIGSWSALWDASEKDADGNATQGDVVTYDTRNTLVRSHDRHMVATIGLDDVVVISTPDATLVASRDKVQHVKQVVDGLNRAGRSEHLAHRQVYRPWGSYDSIDMGERFQVKRIVVKPGSVLSLQMHHHRAEHWIVVSGTAEVTCGEKVFLLTENQSTYIPLGVTHRLRNVGKVPLELIEVQSGSYLGEDDIVRFEDVYGRA